MAYRWETTNSVWWEDENSGQFALRSSKGLGEVDWPALARKRIPDLAQLLGASLPRACAHAPVYPEGFAYCPVCGAALDDAAPPPLPPWWGASSAAMADSDWPLPKYVPRGLPVSALPLAASLEWRAPEPAVGRAELRMPRPPNAPCVFAAANYGFAAQRLLALAFQRNVLQYWDPHSACWQVLSGNGQGHDLGFTTSDYAWLPVPNPRRGEVALLPSAQGLLRLWIDPVGESYRTEPVFAAPLVSAPGAVLNHIACLFTRDAGVRLWSARADGAEPGEFACATEVPAQGWSAPLCYHDRLIWLHAEGHLVWSPGAAPQWLAWPRPWTPRLAFGGPVQSQDGRLWLIGHDGAGYSFLELGRAEGQVERIDGARLGFGKLLFRRGHQVKSDPWDSEEVEDQRQGDALVLPLLQERDRASGLVLRFERYTGKAEAALDGATLGKTLVEWIGARNVILDEIVGLSRPTDCVAFVYDDCLWLQHPKWNEMRGWRLKAPA
ncbi:MAG TPA: hypothetical protein DCW29_17290 [Janthinobacterium sp.]|nr:hypothetical protein [Janthinobacterium sp.]